VHKHCKWNAKRRKKELLSNLIMVFEIHWWSWLQSSELVKHSKFLLLIDDVNRSNNIIGTKHYDDAISCQDSYQSIHYRDFLILQKLYRHAFWKNKIINVKHAVNKQTTWWADLLSFHWSSVIITVPYKYYFL